MKEEKIGVIILTIIFVSLVISLFFIVEPRYTGLAVGQCTDSDNGQNIFLQGTTDDKTTIWVDACQGTDIVAEGYCDTGGVNIVNLPCPGGYTCNTGACVTSTTSTSTTTSISTSSSTSTTTTSESTSTSTSVTTTTSSTTTVSNSTSSSSTSTSSSTSSTAQSSSTSSSSTSSSTSSTTTTSNQSSLSASQEGLCSPDWQCDSWSDCINGIRTRTCSDIENCGFEDKIERERCTATTAETTIDENATAQQALEESGEAGPTGRAVADTNLVGNVAAGIIWGSVVLGAAGYLLNKYNVRWWVMTKHGTKTFFSNAKDYSRAGFARLRYSMNRLFRRQ